MSAHLNIKVGENSGRPVFLDLYLPENKLSAPVMLFLPGFKGFRKWGAWAEMGRMLNQSGIAMAAMDFSHNGTEAPEFNEISNHQSFASNTVQKELDDIQIAMDWLKTNAEKFSINPENIILAGHSKGGGEAILFAANEESIAKIIALAPLTDFLLPFSSADVKAWEVSGKTTVINKRTGAELSVDFNYCKELQSEPEKFDVTIAASMLGNPLLLIHGSNDEAVPVSASEAIYNQCLHSYLIKIEGAGHTFGVTHPWSDSNPLPAAFSEVIDNIIEFILD